MGGKSSVSFSETDSVFCSKRGVELVLKVRLNRHTPRALLVVLVCLLFNFNLLSADVGHLGRGQECGRTEGTISGGNIVIHSFTECLFSRPAPNTCYNIHTLITP